MKHIKNLHKTRFGLIIILLAITSLSWYATRHSTVDFEEDIIEPSIEEVFDPVIEYGIVADSLTVIKGTIQKNQYLSDILLKHHMPYPEIVTLVEKSKPIFNVRNMRTGNNYCVLANNDSTEKIRYFIYEISTVDYVVYDISDSLNISLHQKEVTTEEKTIVGNITSSLYQTLQEQNTNPELAIKLSEIYAWTIDFYRIQKNDQFSVIYEESFVEGKSIGITDIKCAKFIHKGENLYAFKFTDNEKTDYFDIEAKGLRKAFLKAPLKFSRISSGFTMKRFHPVQKRFKAHLGTDYAAPKGTPIMSVGDGEIIEARYSQFNGNYVKVRHNGTYTTQYLHMSKIAKNMRPGVRVKQGDIIGYVGSTGLATGPHVCFRFWKNGKQVNHLAEKFPEAFPVSKQNLDVFTKIKTELKNRLDALTETQKIEV